MKRGLTGKTNWIKALLVFTLLSQPLSLYKAEAVPRAYQEDINTLAPNLKLKPVVAIMEHPAEGNFLIGESPEDLKKIEDFNKEEVAFIYLSYLIGDVLYRYPKIINADILKKLIGKDLGHIDFTRFIWKEIYQINGSFYLPYIDKNGELAVLKYFISEPENAEPENPYSFLTEDGKARVNCVRVPIETRKTSIERTLKYVGEMNDEEVQEELQERLKGKNVLYLSFRLDATDLDGVSQETEKWSETMNDLGARIFYYSGQTKPPKFARGHTYKLAHFLVKSVERLTTEIFRVKGFSWKRFDMVEKINEDKKKIKKDLKAYILKNNIDYLVYENVLSYPGNIALSLAAMELANEMDIPVIAHNHDFYWERKRFRQIREGLKEFFNGIIVNIRKLSSVVICRRQINDLEKIGRADTILIPNVMDYDNPPEISDAQKKEVKEKIRNIYGMKSDEIFLLAPVRPVARKFLKRAVKAAEEIAGKYNVTVNLMVTHPAGDEMDGKYWESVKEFAGKYKNVRIIDASGDIKNKKFSLEDSYTACDFVIYSSNWEGWGNVVAEAVYYKKPMIIYPYRVYREDIKTTGVDFVEMLKLPYEGDFEMDIKEEDYLDEPALSDESLDRIEEIRNDPRKTVDKNYGIFKKNFSYKTLKRGLLAALENIRQIDNRINYENILTRINLIKNKGIIFEEQEPEQEYWLKYFRELLIGKWMTPGEISRELQSRLREDYNGALMIEYLQKMAYMKILTKRFNKDGEPIYKMRDTQNARSLYEIMLYGLNNGIEDESRSWLEDAASVRNEVQEETLVNQFFSILIKAQKIIKERGGTNKKIAIAIQTKWLPKVMEESVMGKMMKDKSFENICIISDRSTRNLAEKIANENVLPENVIVIGPKEIDSAEELKFLKETPGKEAFFAEINFPEGWPENAIDVYYPLLEIINVSMRYAFGDKWQTRYPNIGSIEKLAERIIQITPLAEKVDIILLKKRYDIQAKHIDIMA